MLRSPVGENLLAVIDIGSNSVRLVVFETDHGFPATVYNERVFCGLARNVGATGELAEDAIDAALAAIVRFVRLARDYGSTDLELVATAAIRDAANGAVLTDAVLSRTGCVVKVISGQEEARLSALGVAGSFHQCQGLIGDLGCGSLELVHVGRNGVGQNASLPLGSLRLGAMFSDEMGRIEAFIEQALSDLPWLKDMEGQTFYPVGGSWRALAKINMENKGYPLHILHAYTLKRAEALEFADFISHLGQKSLTGIPNIPQKRLETLPVAVRVFHRVLTAAKPKNVVFSSSGLREGVVFDHMVRAGSADDALLAAAESLENEFGRFGQVGKELFQWISPLYEKKNPARSRIRLAACMVADIGWREHPDYRAEQTMLRLLRQPFLAITHGERVFIALTIYVRYGGRLSSDCCKSLLPILSKRDVDRVQVLGAALRFAFMLSSGSMEILSRTRLSVVGGKLHLRIPDDPRLPSRQSINRNLTKLAKAAWLHPPHVRVVN